MKQYNITVDSHLERKDLKTGRLRTPAQLENLRKEITEKRLSFAEQLEQEFLELVSSGHAHTSPRFPVSVSYSTGTNTMEVGSGTSSTCPVEVRRPVAASTRNTARLFEA